MLKPKKRITKKTLKEDKFVTIAFKINDYLRQEWKRISYVAIGIIAVITITIMFLNSRRRAEYRASAELAMAEISYISGDYENAIREFERIEDIYKGTKSAGVSVFYMANAYFGMKNYTQAEVMYRKYLDDYDHDPMLHSSSLSGIAATYEERKMYDNAVEYYKRAFEDFPDLFTVPENMINAARCLKKLGNKAEAESILRTVIENYSESAFKEKAEIILYQL